MRDRKIGGITERHENEVRKILRGGEFAQKVVDLRKHLEEIEEKRDNEKKQKYQLELFNK